MKKIIIPAISLAALLLTGACSIDERTSGDNGNEAMLTLNMGLDGAVQTRAIGDGTGANKLEYAVFDENGTRIEGIKKVSKEVSFPTTETITLAKGQTYKIAFWAQNKACTAYDVSDKMVVTIDYEGALSNDETRDAFFKTVEVTVTGDAELDVELTRPFAQLNVGIYESDWTAGKDAGIVISTSRAVVRQAASTLNLLDGTVADPKDVTFDFANIPDEDEALSVDLDGEGPEDYKYLSMNYILPYDATTGDASTTLEDLEFTFHPETGNDITLTQGLDAVPVQRNWRTNIIGQILSGDLSLNISIDPGFNGDNNHEIWDGSAEEPKTDPDDANTYLITTPAELAWVAEQVNSKTEYFDGKTILLMNDIDLSGSYWTPVGNVTAYPTVTFKGTFDGQNHVISNLTASDDAAGYAAAGLFGSIVGTVKNVTLKDVNIRSTHYAGAVVAYSSTNGAIIENCHVDGGTITSVPELKGTSYDNGDKAGGIIGYYVTDDKVTKCSAKNLTITAYRDLGGITGCGPKSGMTDCSVENIILVQDNTNGYESEAVTTVGALGGRDVTNGNQPYDGEYASAVTKKIAIVATSNEELAAAAIADNAIIYLTKGEYVIPATAKGKTVTFIGTDNPEDVIVKVVPPTGSYENCDYGLDGSNATFEGITITTNSSTYIGYARCNGTYKNCIINGTYTLYGESTFEDCVFNVSGDVYNIWTWGAEEIEFTGCTFNSDGKALLLYREAGGIVNLTVTGCIFNDKGGLENAMKAAIEIGDSPYDDKPTYNVTVSNTSVNGYAINDKGISTGTTLWGNKDSMPEDRLNVTIDGDDVY